MAGVRKETGRRSKKIWLAGCFVVGILVVVVLALAVRRFRTASIQYQVGSAFGDLIYVLEREQGSNGRGVIRVPQDGSKWVANGLAPQFQRQLMELPAGDYTYSVTREPPPARFTVSGPAFREPLSHEMPNYPILSAPR